MTINERLFQVMKDNNVSIRELARRTGITASTISDWKTKDKSPSAEKISLVCDALGISTEYILRGKDSLDMVLSEDEISLIEAYRNTEESQKKRLLAYFINMSKTGEG